jgi:hypothetical protein
MLAEARQRIGRAAPELSLGWTDHNESDPGMVLLELFAWLAQITQERVNQLPSRAYRSMLHLLGLDIQPAASAIADLVFDAIPGARSGISVREGTRVGAPPDPNGFPVVFQTVKPLDLVTAELAHLLIYDGSTFTEVTARNEPGGGTILPFGQRPESGAALYFGFADPQASEAGWRPFPTRISLRAFEPDTVVTPAPITCAAAPVRPRAELEWAYLPGPDKVWKPLTVYEDETRALEVGGYLTLEGPSDIEAAPLWIFTDPLQLHYWLRLRVRNPDYGGRVPEVAFFRFNAVRARHEVTVNDLVVAVSDGKPDQVMKLQWTPVVPHSLQIEVVDEGREPRPWTGAWREVELFRAKDPDMPDDPDAGPDAMVYRFDPEKGEIHFGDGVRAAIPPPGSQVVARSYRFGGGQSGNVAADEITSLQASLGGVRGVSNPRPAVGGRNAEPVEQALRRAPQWLRRVGRAVTAQDFEDVALRVGGVARAKALPNAHPEYPGVKVPGAVTVLIVQDTTQRRPPRPTEPLMRAVCDALDKQRTLTTEVYVRSPRFVRIDVEAKLTVDPTKSTSAAEDQARKQIERYLSPIQQPPDPTLDATPQDGTARKACVKEERLWRFGQDLYPANLQSQLLSLPEEVGIRAVPSLRIHFDGELHDSPTGPIELSEDSLPYPGTLDMRGSPDTEA